jgi:hypothetical protein
MTIPSTVFRTSLLLLCIAAWLTLPSATLDAQTPQFSHASTANSNNIFPFQSTSTTKVQQNFMPNEFPGAYAGNITTVYFRRNTASSATTYTNLKVWLGLNPANAWPSTTSFYTSVTQHLNAATFAIPAGAAGDWFAIPLTTPFYYNPAQAFAIIVCHEGYTGGGIQIRSSSMTTPPMRRLWANGCNTTTGSTDGNWYDFGIDMNPTLPDDAGIASLVSPVSFCAGTEDIKVKLRNFGTNTISNVTVNWSFDNIAQTPINYTTPIPSNTEVELTLGTRTFTSGITYPLLVYTSQPNNVTDSFQANDTLRANLKAAISGNYTIGGASPDYPTINAAAADLVANGICGPVVFDIRSGSYPTSAALGAIPGASVVNTITFRSETGNKGDVTLTNNATSTLNNFVVNFAGASFVTFRNLTMTSTNLSFSTVLNFGGSSTDILVENCDLNSPVVASTGANNYVINSPSGTLNHRTTIRDCRIVGGSMGAYIWGASTTSYLEDWTLERCQFENYYYMGFYGYYLDRLKFVDNSIITNSAYSTLYPAYMYYQRALSFERNTILTTTVGNRYGILCGYTQPGAMNRIVNNFVTLHNTGANTMYGLYPLYSNDLLMAHNTVFLNGTSPTASRTVYQIGGTNNRFVNNIFYNAGTGYAMYIGTPTAITEMDYNAYFTTGPNIGYWNANQATLTNWKAATARDANAVAKPVSFRNLPIGDLHLVAPSDDDNDLIGVLLPTVTDDIDNEPRVRPYMGADEACYLIANSLTYDFVDGSGNPIGYVELPGTIGVHYRVIFPPFDATITMTANFYSVPGNQLMYSETFSDTKLAGQDLNGTSYFNLPSTLPSGYYKIELVFNTKNSCGYYRDYMPYPSSLLLVPLGATPCEVWPGDVNNDGVVNYADRKDLNEYIHDANLSTQWLNGPARYRADAVQNPLTYLQWQPQASAPWFTAMGCYMDADGNGVVNNFDYLAIKLNWMRQHGGVTPRSDNGFTPTTFDMSQNFPNPFNPTTTLQYSVPEPSRVHLRVVDMLGRVVATAVDGTVETGVHQYVFDASNLPSGQYMAIVNMTGNESGLGFSKTVKMTLNK